jgi:drug/metabolite transporter (DMT)-like permease
MTPLVAGLVLCAALLHATWNALLRSGTDRLWSITVMSVTTALLAAPALLILPLPAPASWPYLGLSAVLQVGYSLVLVLAYRHAELGQVYPIVRGSAPLLVTLGAALVAGEQVGVPAASGIALISLGIMSLALGKSAAKPVAIAAALGTGIVIASYSVTDGMGVRLSGNPYAYATWIFVLYGALMPPTFLALRRRLPAGIGVRDTLKAAAAGLVQLLTYGVVIWAYTMSAIGPVAALRETSVVFAALIGRAFLGETLTLRRLAACAVIALGAFCLSWHG